MALDEFCGMGGGAVNLGTATRPVWIGGDAPPVWMGGPCAVESEAQIHACAAALATAGGQVLRGGAFKPRTRPDSFQGLGVMALRWLRQAADAHGLLVVTEALGLESLGAVADSADIVQVGARNAQNFELLRALGRQSLPVLLKRGPACTLEEWLGAAEYIWQGGNQRVVLCERGIRSFGQTTRYMLDLGAVIWLRQNLAGVPVVVDPSHAMGARELVPAATLAALAAGADGILFECHPEPETALSDRRQQLPLTAMAGLMGVGQRLWTTLRA